MNRNRVKQLEFVLPTKMQRVIHYLGTVASPYSEKDDALKAIFIHIPKAAGRSVRKALFDLNSFHIPISRYRAANESKFRRYLKFTFVRNPWDRLASAYFHYYKKVGREDERPETVWANNNLKSTSTFETFVLRLYDDKKFCRSVRLCPHFRDQLDWISAPTMDGRSVLVDYIGKYETLERDFRIICRELSIKKSLDFVGGGSQITDYRSLYQKSRMVDAVNCIYQHDVQAFGYSFG